MVSAFSGRLDIANICVLLGLCHAGTLTHGANGCSFFSDPQTLSRRWKWRASRAIQSLTSPKSILQDNGKYCAIPSWQYIMYDVSLHFGLLHVCDTVTAQYIYVATSAQQRAAAEPGESASADLSAK